MLREALRGWLPDEILDRPKRASRVPLGDWLRGELRELRRARCCSTPRRSARGYFREDAVRGCSTVTPPAPTASRTRIWSLLMLELWHREFVEGRASVPAPALAAEASA